MTKLYIKKLSNNATTPTRGSSKSAGMDLYAARNYTVLASKRRLISTDIAFEIPEGYYIRIAPRSGLAHKNGIDIFAGVLDQDYIGPCGVILYNSDIEDFYIKKGDRIAQAILEKIDIPEIIEVDSLESTERGSAGFGSTGV